MTLLAPTQRKAHIPTWTLADRLRKAREDANLTQQELAELTGISHTSIKNYEGGKRTPRVLYLRAWSEATGVPACWLDSGQSCGCDLEPPAGLEPATCGLQGDHFPDFVPAWLVEAVAR